MPADIRTAYRELVEITGSLIQEAKHHHNGRGRDLEPPPLSEIPRHSGIPLPVRNLLVQLEQATAPEKVAEVLGDHTRNTHSNSGERA